MVSKIRKGILATILTALSVTGLLAGFKEYAKSFVRESVKEEILDMTDTGDLVFKVPAIYQAMIRPVNPCIWQE